MKKILKNLSGFTLVELLVVITIIAILSVVGLTLFNGAQISARDARRKADVDAIANALEIKKAPGVVSYQTIAVTDMSSGLIPEDSVNGSYVYCIRVYPTDTEASGDTSVTAGAWATACPASFNPATISSGLSGASFGTTNKSFKICARLEVSGGIYCKNSAQ